MEISSIIYSSSTDQTNNDYGAMAQSTVVVSLKLQVFHEISWIYQNSQDCLENSLNPKLIPKFPRSWENSQALAALSERY